MEQHGGHPDLTLLGGDASPRSRVRLMLDGEDPVLGRSVALSLQALIVLSAVTLAIETLPGLSPASLAVLSVLEFVIVAIFTIEYLLRLWSAKSAWRYAISFWGIIDLLAILPSLLALGVDGRALRSLRLARLLRLLKLGRYSEALTRITRALREVKEELVVFLGMALVLLYLGGAGIYYFEHETQPDAFVSIPHSLWWAVSTLTTVGYGDIYPVTAGGKIFTFFLLIIGLGVVAIPTGLLATALMAHRKGKDEDKPKA